MRVPEISLGYGLLAQNKHDLCRYYKYTERHKQTQYLPAYTVSFMVVPSVRAWEFRVRPCTSVVSQHLGMREKERTVVKGVLSLFLLVTKRLYGKGREWSIGQIKMCCKKHHVRIDDMKEMPD